MQAFIDDDMLFAGLFESKPLASTAGAQTSSGTPDPSAAQPPMPRLYPKPPALTLSLTDRRKPQQPLANSTSAVLPASTTAAAAGSVPARTFTRQQRPSGVLASTINTTTPAAMALLAAATATVEPHSNRPTHPGSALGLQLSSNPSAARTTKNADPKPAKLVASTAAAAGADAGKPFKRQSGAGSAAGHDSAAAAAAGGGAAAMQACMPEVDVPSPSAKPPAPASAGKPLRPATASTTHKQELQQRHRQQQQQMHIQHPANVQTKAQQLGFQLMLDLFPSSTSTRDKKPAALGAAAAAAAAGRGTGVEASVPCGFRGLILGPTAADRKQQRHNCDQQQQQRRQPFADKAVEPAGHAAKAYEQHHQRHQQYQKQQQQQQSRKRSRLAGNHSADEYSEPERELDAPVSSNSGSSTTSSSRDDSAGNSGSLWSAGNSEAAEGRGRSSSNDTVGGESSDGDGAWLVMEGKAGSRARSQAAIKRQKKMFGAAAAPTTAAPAPPPPAAAAAAGEYSKGGLDSALQQQAVHALQLGKLPAKPAALQGEAAAAAAAAAGGNGRKRAAATAAAGGPGREGSAVVVPGEVRVLLPSAASLARQKVLLVELPACFDITGDSGAIGRVVCSKAAGAAAGQPGLTGTAKLAGRVLGNSMKQGGTITARKAAAGHTGGCKVGQGGDEPGADAAGSEDDSGSEGSFAQQLKALLNGHAAVAAAAESGDECQSETGDQECDQGSEKSESDQEGEGGVAQEDGAGVTAVCLDLKGMVFSTQVLPLAGTAAVVRINMPGPKSSKEASAHIEHLFDSSFIRAAAGAAGLAGGQLDLQQQQPEGGEFAAFESDDEDDAARDSYAAALKVSAAWGAEEGGEDGDAVGPARGKKQKQKQQKQKGARGDKAGAGSTAARRTGHGVRGRGRGRARGAGLGGAAKQRGGSVADMAGGAAAAAGKRPRGGAAGKAAKKQKQLEPWEVSNGDGSC